MKQLGSIITAKGAILAATALVMSPAIAAGLITAMPGESDSLNTPMGRFTPASGNPELLKQLTRISEKSSSNFRFTPAIASNDEGKRALTVVVRAPSSAAAIRKPMAQSGMVPTLSDRVDAKPIAIAPVAYNLGTKVGIDRFAVTDRTKLDLAAMPKAKPVSAPATRSSRLDTVMRVDSIENATDRPLDGDRAVEVDLATSYKVTRNLKVTAGVRYKQDTDRLQPLTDNRRDSQAVYVGTQVRF